MGWPRPTVPLLTSPRPWPKPAEVAQATRWPVALTGPSPACQWPRRRVTKEKNGGLCSGWGSNPGRAHIPLSPLPLRYYSKSE